MSQEDPRFLGQPVCTKSGAAVGTGLCFLGHHPEFSELLEFVSLKFPCTLMKDVAFLVQVYTES